MTKTVLMVINTSWNIFNFRAGLIGALKQAGYRVITAAPEDAYTERLRSMVDAHYTLPMENDGTSPVRDLALTRRFIRLLQQTRPDMMLTYTIKPNIYGSLAARLCAVPVIANVSGLGTTFIRNNWLTAVVKRLYRVAFRSASCVFFQNPVDRDLFIGMKLVAPEKTALLPGSGIDLTHFAPVAQPLPLASAPVRFVLIARMLWDKGIGEFIAAARIVKAKHPHTVFRLVGARGVKNKTAIPDATIDGWVSEGIVEYLGETDAIREVIAQQDCVVLPSYREGMSRVLLEAAAMGKPLIASDVPGCTHVVTPAVNGLLCAPRDAESLARAMQEFIGYSPAHRAQMGAASRAKAEQEFDERNVFAAYLDRIRAILA